MQTSLFERQSSGKTAMLCHKKTGAVNCAGKYYQLKPYGQ